MWNRLRANIGGYIWALFGSYSEGSATLCMQLNALTLPTIDKYCLASKIATIIVFCWAYCLSVKTECCVFVNMASVCRWMTYNWTPLDSFHIQISDWMTQELCEKFHQVDTKTILITLYTTKITYFVIDVSTSRRKFSSGLTSGSGRQYVRICPIRGSIESN